MAQDALNIIRTLAADHHSAEIDLSNNHVWELNEHGDPPAIAMRTSFGLRCNGMRIFPQFNLQGGTRIDPATFDAPVIIVERHGDYLQLECSPFSQLNVQLEYWVPASQVLAGRFRVTNTSNAAINLTVAWAVILNPIDPGEAMSAAQIGVNSVLQGKSGKLVPVFFLTGGPEAMMRAYPSLDVRMTLAVGASRRLSWALATLDSGEASFSLARQSTSLQWDVEAVRAKMQSRNSIIEINNGMEGIPDLLHESQVKARQLLAVLPPPGKELTFVTRRKPDGRNFSPATRREEFISFSQINAYDAWMLSRVLLPGDPDAVKEIIASFIAQQQSDGAIPWVISKTGNPSAAMTPPLLAGIACDVHSFVDDQEWLAEIFPPLLCAFKAWFERNPGALSTWDDPAQTGLEDNPIYKTNLPGMVHNPALDTLLYNECDSLLKLSILLNASDDESWLKKTKASLASALDACWDEKRATFCYRDSRSGLSHAAEKVHEFARDGVFRLKRNFKQPRRFTLSTPAQSGSSGIVSVKLTGKNGEREISEELDIRPGMAARQAISARQFTRLESVEVSGLKTKTILALGLAGNDAEDISLLLPLWSTAVDERRKTALIEKTMLPLYLSEHGLTTFPADRTSAEDNSISPFWNQLIIEGLLRSGRRDLAAKVLAGLLDAQSAQWQRSGFVSSLLNAATLRSMGELDTLAGLPAIWPLLRVAGLEKITENELILKGLNEHLSSITVQYKRATVKMSSELTTIQTVNGNLIECRERTPCRVVLP
jgi:hypothetical protein